MEYVLLYLQRGVAIFTIIILFLANSICIRDCMGRHKYRSFSTRTAYRGPCLQNLEDDIPGCSTQAVYLLLRHGSRYPGADEIEAINFLLPHLRNNILASAKKGGSHLCPSVIEEIRRWKPHFTADQHLFTALSGLQESYDIGHRMRSRFPSLLNLTWGEWAWRLQLRATNNPRSKLSVAAFIKGLLLMEKGEGLAEHDAFRASKYARVVNVSQTEDHLLLYCDLCQKYIEQRMEKDDSEKVQEALFDKKKDILLTIQEVGKLIGLESDVFNLSTVRTLYEACRFEYALYGVDTWCSVLPSEVLEILEYRQDMKYYWRYGYGKLLNYQPSCLLLKDILGAFRNASQQKWSEKLFLRVGHSRSMLPLIARLGLFRDREPLLSRNYKHHRHRLWRLGTIDPFSSNLMFSLHFCSGKHYVQVFLNEKPIVLPACDSSLCPLQTLIKAWRQYTDVCSLEAHCDSVLNLTKFDPDLLHHL